jgi:hypothetical protein
MPTAEPDAGMTAADQFHIGIVVDDPASAMSDLTALFGYEWCDQLGGPVAVSLPSGDTTIQLQAWYSKSEPRLEIVQSIPGTVWTPAAGSGVHHLGYWVDDVAAGSAELERRGYAVEAVGRRPDGVPYWAYHRSPAGPRVELVSRKLRPTLESYFATGSVPS